MPRRRDHFNDDEFDALCCCEFVSAEGKLHHMMDCSGIDRACQKCCCNLDATELCERFSRVPFPGGSQKLPCTLFFIILLQLVVLVVASWSILYMFFVYSFFVFALIFGYLKEVKPRVITTSHNIKDYELHPILSKTTFNIEGGKGDFNSVHINTNRYPTPRKRSRIFWLFTCSTACLISIAFYFWCTVTGQYGIPSSIVAFCNVANSIFIILFFFAKRPPIRTKPGFRATCYRVHHTESVLSQKSRHRKKENNNHFEFSTKKNSFTSTIKRRTKEVKQASNDRVIIISILLLIQVFGTILSREPDLFSLEVLSLIFSLFCIIFCILNDSDNICVNIPYGKNTIKCAVCDNSKNISTKHCGFCDVCVIDYDHHCVWLNECIGRGNRLYFIAFICTATIYTLVVSLGLLCQAANNIQIEYIETTSLLVGEYSRNNMTECLNTLDVFIRRDILSFGKSSFVLATCVYSFGTFIALFALSVSQITYISNGMTTYEIQRRKKRNESK